MSRRRSEKNVCIYIQFGNDIDEGKICFIADSVSSCRYTWMTKRIRWITNGLRIVGSSHKG